MRTIDDVSSTSSRRSLDFEATVVRVANTATRHELDVVIGLDRRAVQGLTDGRPFQTLEQVDATPWVGPSALEKLYAYGVQNAVEPMELEELAASYPQWVLSVFADWDSADMEAFEAEGFDGLGVEAIRGLVEFQSTIADCDVRGRVYTSFGQWYDHMSAAYAATPPGGAVLLCEGAFGFSANGAPKELRAVGLGASRTRTGSDDLDPWQPALLANLTWTAETRFEGFARLSNIEAERPLHLDHGGEIEGSLFREPVSIHAPSRPVSVVDTQFEGSVLDVDLFGTGSLYVGGAVFTGGGLKVRGQSVYPVSPGSTSATITDSTFWNNPVGIDLGTGDLTLRYFRSDFGVGATDNGVDIRNTDGDTWTWLHEDESGSCTPTNCL